MLKTGADREEKRREEKRREEKRREEKRREEKRREEKRREEKRIQKAIPPEKQTGSEFFSPKNSSFGC
ncbi:hypothetical protein HGM15179_010558 [Zosterops borbonicus]|uniref:Uncharacterized protein n=1 Tax=Zosterops borbonicus TaxID=364589 RepID=A0A8K1LJJ4_9PASS|nr:hypothetical protein HGM15179_010558 [Zosterops borbonicus]